MNEDTMQAVHRLVETMKKKDIGELSVYGASAEAQEILQSVCSELNIPLKTE